MGKREQGEARGETGEQVEARREGKPWGGHREEWKQREATGGKGRTRRGNGGGGWREQGEETDEAKGAGKGEQEKTTEGRGGGKSKGR